MADYVNWMATTPGLGGKLLREVCLPATHDSGTMTLAMPMVDDPSDAMAAVLDELQGIAGKIGEARIIPNPLGSLETDAASTIQGLSVATTQSIAQQLEAGIRCLDLRVSYDPVHQEFFTYHGLTGTNLTDVLADIAAFLGSTAEVLYITMGHYTDGVTQAAAYSGTFSSTVKAQLGGWAYPRSTFQLGWYRAGNQCFYLADSESPDALSSFQYGNDGDLPLAGDWNGDGEATVGVYRPGDKTFYLAAGDAEPAASVYFSCEFAAPGDVPVAGRWTAAASADGVGLFRAGADGSSTFYLWSSFPANGEDIGDPDATVSLSVGVATTYTPLAGDWVGHGYDSVGLHRGDWGTFYLWNTNNGGVPDATFQYGNAGDHPVVGDWTSSGVTTIGVLRDAARDGSTPATFYLNYANDQTNGSLVIEMPDAQALDVPLALDSAPANPFNQTIASLTGDFTGARVVLVNDASPDPVFWPGIYSPPSGSPGNPVLAGFYTDTDTGSTMIAAQATQLTAAIAGQLPFALYLTVTPSTSDSVDRVLTALAKPLLEIAALVTLLPWIAAILAGIAASYGPRSYPWHTLEELTAQMTSGTTLTDLVLNQILPPGTATNPISIIYADFYESTTLVDLAIQLSSL